MSGKLLARQLKALGLSPELPPPDAATWQAFLAKVTRAYADGDQDRYLLERSLQISSREMQEQWQQIEEERARSVQAGKLATLGEMAGGVAHEINNPLAIIKLNAELLAETVANRPADDKLIKRCAQKICETTMRISKIISGLRTFARMADDDPFEATPVESIIDEVLALCGAALKEKEIELRWERSPVASVAECRSTQISQVILNLISNARDAVGEQPDGRWIELQVRDTGNFVEVSVTDSGPGIPAGIREKIMEPFFTTKEVGKGTGLGLSISKGIMDLHNGLISLDTASAHTRFVISLPKLHREKSSVA